MTSDERYNAEYIAKIRSVGFSHKHGTSQREAVTDERDGTVAGHVTKHWDGAQDAEVMARPVNPKAGVQR